MSGTAANASPTPADPKKVPLAKRLIFAGLGGVAGATVVYPLDLAKSILQDQKIVPGVPPEHKGILDIVTKNFRADGIRGIYRGYSANLIGIMPEKGTKFFVNDTLRIAAGCEGTAGCMMVTEMACGATAGMTQQVFTVPMELFKILMQTRKAGEAKRSLGSLLQEAVRERGIRGLFTGAGASLLRDIPFSIMYFTLYSYGKRNVEAGREPGKPLGMLDRLGVSTCAGLVASALSTPADVIKTRCQKYPNEYPNIRTAAGKIIREEGVPAFFKGIGPRMLIIAPLFGVAMMTYETLCVKFG